jgi:hypothetical protein
MMPACFAGLAQPATFPPCSAYNWGWKKRRLSDLMETHMTPEEMREKAIDLFKKRFH